MILTVTNTDVVMVNRADQSRFQTSAKGFDFPLAVGIYSGNGKTLIGTKFQRGKNVEYDTGVLQLEVEAFMTPFLTDEKTYIRWT